MRAGGGKSKGAGFERLVCQQLSLWVSGGTHKDLFWRSAMSGGRATVFKKKGVVLNRQAGDISAIAPEGHVFTNKYYVECKFYRTLQLERFFLEDAGPLAKFWRETCTHAAGYEKSPLLIAKQNRGPIMVLFEGPVRQDTPASYTTSLVMPPSGRAAVVTTLKAFLSKRFET